MFEGKKVKGDKKGKVSYERSILNSIVMLAASEIEGVNPFDPNRKAKFCKIDFVEGGVDEVYVTVRIRVLHGYSVSDIAYKIQENIKRSVETMTSFTVKEVNVQVDGVVFEDDKPAIAADRK